MISKWGVFIYCQNGTGNYHYYTEVDDFIAASRVIITFKPRRGWEVVKVEIAEAEQMELELFEKARWE